MPLQCKGPGVTNPLQVIEICNSAFWRDFCDYGSAFAAGQSYALNGPEVSLIVTIGYGAAIVTPRHSVRGSFPFPKSHDFPSKAFGVGGSVKGTSRADEHIWSGFLKPNQNIPIFVNCQCGLNVAVGRARNDSRLNRSAVQLELVPLNSCSAIKVDGM